jgi:nickel-dependent lactate racemase
MKVTIIQDVCGYLHIFVGQNIKINNLKRKNTYHFNNNKFYFDIPENSEADMFFQSEADVNVIKDNLSEMKLSKLNNGHKISTIIDILYFQNTLLA